MKIRFELIRTSYPKIPFYKRGLIWICQDQKTSQSLGMVEKFSNKWVLNPRGGIVFDSFVLESIIDFLGQLNDYEVEI